MKKFRERRANLSKSEIPTRLVLPLSRFRFTCGVEPAGGKTKVSQSVKVVGPMGWLFDPMMGDQIANDFDGLLDGLVKKAEAGS